MKTNKRSFSLILAIVLLLTMTFANATTALAVTSSKTVTTSKSMSVILNQGSTGDSSTVSFTVSGLPKNAVVTKIVVNTGSLTYRGGVLTNKLILASSNKSGESSIAWLGAANTNLTFDTQFYNTPANGTYQIRFNATCISGYISGGVLTNIGTKAYRSPSITIYYE